MLSDTWWDTERFAETTLMLVIEDNTPIPEFPSTFVPASMIIGFLGAVLLIQRTREQ
jgi:hypothetical protein